jgi:ribosomal protein S18 acetylase RimI-like enzyme
LSFEDLGSIQELKGGQEPEVLRFLEARPLQTVFLRGFILDNGLDSQLNRGAFYGYRNGNGGLEGVALIGHATLFETRSLSAIRQFGYHARLHRNIHLIMGEQHSVHIFWNALVASSEAMPQMALAESGVDPMQVDPVGFEDRCSRRIEMDRVWVSVENGTLTFKADILSETPDVTYVEGVYVDPGYRGNGYGLKCLTQMGASLCEDTRSLCLFVNANAHEAQQFYRRAGFSLGSVYTTIFLDG